MTRDDTSRYISLIRFNNNHTQRLMVKIVSPID